MSAEHLGRRLGITKQGVLRVERGEQNQQLSLASLRKVADALDADLVYAIVPRKPLQQTLEDRARELARARTRRVAHSMHLEEQGVADAEQEQQISDYAAELLKRPRELWK
jgi:predicted DNA-binding mobile mystery protein A